MAPSYLGGWVLLPRRKRGLRPGRCIQGLGETSDEFALLATDRQPTTTKLLLQCFDRQSCDESSCRNLCRINRRHPATGRLRPRASSARFLRLRVHRPRVTIRPVALPRSLLRLVSRWGWSGLSWSRLSWSRLCCLGRLRLRTARAGNRRSWLLSAPRAHTKARDQHCCLMLLL